MTEFAGAYSKAPHERNAAGVRAPASTQTPDQRLLSQQKPPTGTTATRTPVAARDPSRVRSAELSALSAPRPAATLNPMRADPAIARGRRTDSAARCRVGPRACPGAPASLQQPMHRDPCSRSNATAAWPRGRLPLPFPDIVAERRFRMDSLTRVKVLTPDTAGCRPRTFVARRSHPWPVADRRGQTAHGKGGCSREPPAQHAVMRFKHMPRFQWVRGRRGASPGNFAFSRLPARYTGGPRRCARRIRLFQDRRGGCWWPQDTRERPRHRAAITGADCPVSGFSAAVTGALCDRVRGRRR